VPYAHEKRTLNQACSQNPCDGAYRTVPGQRPFAGRGTRYCLCRYKSLAAQGRSFLGSSSRCSRNVRIVNRARSCVAAVICHLVVSFSRLAELNPPSLSPKLSGFQRVFEGYLRRLRSRRNGCSTCRRPSMNQTSGRESVPIRLALTPSIMMWLVAGSRLTLIHRRRIWSRHKNSTCANLRPAIRLPSVMLRMPSRYPRASQPRSVTRQPAPLSMTRLGRGDLLHLSLTASNVN
jgi:hypothetical protein